MLRLAKIVFKHGKTSNNICVKLSGKDTIMTVDLSNITLKSPKGFVKPEIIAKNQIVYENLKGGRIKSYLSMGIQVSQFFSIVDQVLNITKYIIDNGLLLECLVKNIDYIFFDDENKVRMIYVPISHMAETEDMLWLLSYMADSAVLKNKSEMKELRDFKNCLSSLSAFDIDKIRKELPLYKNFLHELDEDEPTDLMDESTELIDDDKTDLADETETYIMNEFSEQVTGFPKLKRLSTNEVVYINKSVFRIGKDKNCVDYFIDNVAVSRSHADIIVRGTRCFIIDLKSKNKTYINDNVIPINTEYELHNDDVITLADEEFIINF